MALLTNINGKFSVSDAGAVTFNNAFTFPTADGTANYVLKTNGSGQLAWGPDNDGGDITGSGTANTVTKFTGAKTIGDGPITFSSNDSTFAGRIDIDGSPVATGDTRAELSIDENNSASAGRGGGLTFGRQGNVYGGIKTLQNTSSNDNATMYFQTIGGGTVSNRMVIDELGNVGIGDTSPQGKLEVNNRNTATGAALFIKGGEDDLDPVAGQYTGLAFGYGGGDIYNNASILWEFTNTAANGKLHFAVNPTAGDGTADLSDSKMTILDSGNVGIGDTTPTSKLTILGTSTAASNTPSDAIVDIHGTSTAHLLMGVANVSPYGAWINTDATGQPLVLQGVGGNVGIGTTTPSSFSGYTNLSLKGGSTGNNLDFFNSAGTRIGAIVTDGSDDVILEASGLSKNLIFKTDNAGTFSEKMRITSAGNVGIGTDSPGYKLSVANASTRIVSINYQDSLNTIMSHAGSPNYGLEALTIRGDYIAFYTDYDTSHYQGLERMRIDSSGNVLINATSKYNGYPSTFVTQTLASSSGDVCPILELVGNRDASAGNQNAMIQFFNKTSTAVEVGRITSAQGSAVNSGELQFHTANAGTLTERMRITNAGQIVFPRTGQPPITNALYGNIVLDSNAVTNFQRIRYDVGTTPYWGLTRLNTGNFAITGGSTWNDHALEIDYTTQNVFIDQKLAVGQTTAPGRMLEVNGGTTNDGGIKLTCSANLSNFWSGIEFRSSVATSFIYMASNDADGTLKFLPDASLKATLSKAGTWTVAADVVAYGSPSDKRLKENIKPIESALDKVMKLEGVTFDWIQKEDQILDIKEDIGFIAQDVQKVVPELVRENEDGMLSMRHQGVAPILLEAIKELKAEIEELKKYKCDCKR